jgi:hypothetical protein
LINNDFGDLFEMSQMTRACLVGLITWTATAMPAYADIGSSMVTLLQGRIGTRMGGGECAHMATEALRISGGEFYPGDLGADSPNSGDSVWGTLVTTISYSTKWTDSNPTNHCLPGDVIQYRNAVFTTSTTVKGKTTTTTVSCPQHTSVVSTVNTGGRPTAVFQQNFNNVRTVQTASIDTTKLTAGWIRIYRPKARKDTVDVWKVSVVNNASTSQKVDVTVGTSVLFSLSLTQANTAGSYAVYEVTTTGTVPCNVLSNGTSVYSQSAKGDNIYNPTSTTVGIQQLSQ